MAEKKIRIREAKARDLGLFRKLWKAHLELNEKNGSVVCPTDKNLATLETLFEHYVGGGMQGVVLFIADYAVFMAGDGPAADFNCGKTAHLWGCYVEPGKEVGEQLVNEGLKRLKDKGFNTAVFNAVANHGVPLAKAETIGIIVKVPLD